MDILSKHHKWQRTSSFRKMRTEENGEYYHNDSNVFSYERIIVNCLKNHRLTKNLTMMELRHSKLSVLKVKMVHDMTH